MAAAVPPKLELLLPRFKPGNPVSLTGSVVLNPGSTLPVNIDALRNPSKLPLAIHEIKFVSTTVVKGAPVSFTAPPSGFAPPTSSALLETTISIGDHSITRVPIPVNLLGVRRSAGSEVLNVGPLVGESFFGLSNQVWRLDEPIILRGGQELRVAIGHRGFYPYPVTAYVTISGKFLSSLPKTMHLTYVSAFVPAAFLPNAGTSDPLVRTSTERDLVNELGIPLRVRRFTGRVASTFAGEALFDLLPTPNSFLLTVSMRSSAGVPTVRNDTPFENVFDVHSASLSCPHVLPPSAYWIATLKCAGTQANAGVQVMPGIAIHGTREVRS